MARGWERLLRQIRRERRAGASQLQASGIEAAHLFLKAVRHLRPEPLTGALEEFTLRLTASQPSMAPFLTLANALWLAEDERGRPPWQALHDALVRYGSASDRALEATVRRAAGLVPSNSIVLTYSNSTAVRLALWRAVAEGKLFVVTCSESRPMNEGVALARFLAERGVPVYLVVDAGLFDWLGIADLVLVGADAILSTGVVNKIGTEPLLQAARRLGVPVYVLADSTKWLPDRLSRFWRVRPESPAEIATLRHPNLEIPNRCFDTSPLKLVTGIVWEGGLSRPAGVRNRIARLPVSKVLEHLLATGRRRASLR
jgi:translation initiation factor 2B subunit (eIF-2B alpha/beta/delta family)